MEEIIGTRVIKQTHANGDVIFYPQIKKLDGYFSIGTGYNTVEEAENYIKEYEGHRVVTEEVVRSWELVKEN